MIRCERCVLRPWRPDDLDALVFHANNDEVAANLRDAFPHPYTEADGRAWLSLAVGQQPPLNFAIEAGGQPVGGIGMKLGSDIERISAEVGYWLGETARGRGLATDAVRGLAGYAFGSLGLQRLFALPFADNGGSRRVLEKAGFALEGVLRQSAVKRGRIRDQALYALLRG